MDDISLEDLVYTYPSNEDQYIQKFVSDTKEFSEVGAPASERPPDLGGFFNHQLLVHRLINVYDRLLLIHRAGTGKTCAAVGGAEAFKRAFASGLSDYVDLYMRAPRSNIKHVYVITKGQTIQDIFKSEIICKCSPPNEYETTGIETSRNESARSRAVNSVLKKYYTFTSYYMFTKNLDFTPAGIQATIEKYSDCLFIMDEGHNTNSGGIDGLVDASWDDFRELDRLYEVNKANEKNRIKALVDAGSLEQEEGNKQFRRWTRQNKPFKTADQKHLIYKALHNLFHTVLRSKVLILTATPMINEVGEVAPIMNLLLPLSNQMPTRNQGIIDYSNVTLNDVFRYFNGIVSYVRESDTGVDVEHAGIPLSSYNITYNISGRDYLSTYTIFMSPMSDFQYNVYLRILNRTSANPTLDQVTDTKTGSDFRIKERQSLIFVYPDGSFGNAGFNRYIIHERADNYRISPEFRTYLDTVHEDGLTGLQRSSMKVSDIIAQCENAHIPLGPHTNQVITNDMFINSENMISMRAKSFIFSLYVSGSGAILISLMFEYQGWERFDGTVFPSNRVGNESRFCGSDVADPSEQINIPVNYRRFAIITGQTSKSKSSNIMKLFNHPQNYDGRYIRAIIISPVGGEGISFMDTTEDHLVGPDWTEGSMYQAERRTVRVTSHINLRRKILGAKIRLFNDVDATERIKIKMYRHASVAYRDGNFLLPLNDQIDLSMYAYSEQKDIEIKGMERFMKQSAIDCNVNRNRNIHENDVDGTQNCDYQDCNYFCAVDLLPPREDEIDDRSYDILYSGPIVEIIISNIRQLFVTNDRLSFETLYDRIREMNPDNYKNKYVDMAIERMISERIPVRNRYGYTQYVNTDGRILFTQNTYPTVIGTEDDYMRNIQRSYYSSNLIGVESRNIDDLIAENSAFGQRQLMDSLLGYVNIADRTFREGFNSLSALSKIMILEDSLVNASITGAAAGGVAIRDLLGGYWMRYKYSNSEIDKIREKRINPVITRGRRRNINKALDPISEEDFQIVESNILDSDEYVFVHHLHDIVFRTQKYDILTKIPVRMRIYIPSEGIGWRDVTVDEYTYFAGIIGHYNRENARRYEQNDVYGVYLKIDESLSIVDNRDLIDASDRRNISTGRLCSGIPKDDLIDIMYYMEPKIYPEQYPEPTGTVLNMFSNLISRSRKVSSHITMSDDPDDIDKIRFFYIWYTVNVISTVEQRMYNVPEMCDLILRELHSRGLLLIR
jgi:hypothetical protein